MAHAGSRGASSQRTAFQEHDPRTGLGQLDGAGGAHDSATDDGNFTSGGCAGAAHVRMPHANWSRVSIRNVDSAQTNALPAIVGMM